MAKRQPPTSSSGSDDTGRARRGASRRQLLRQSGGAALVGAALARGLRTGRVGAQDATDALVGSWIVAIAYAGQDAQRTRGLATFTPGGGFIGSISAYETAPANPTPARGSTLHGTWRASSDGSFTVTAARLHLDGQGTLLGVMQTQITGTLAADGASWTGRFRFDAADPVGNVFRSDQGTVDATPIPGAGS